MSVVVAKNREKLEKNKSHGFVTVIPVDYSRHRGFPQPPDQYSDYASHDTDYSHADNSNSQLEDLTGNGNLYKTSGGYSTTSEWETSEKLKEASTESTSQNMKVCVYLMTDVALHMEVEDGANAMVQDFTQAILCDEQLRIPRTASNMFSLWMSSGLLGLLH